jgi:hypothetical protein
MASALMNSSNGELWIEDKTHSMDCNVERNGIGQQAVVVGENHCEVGR